MIGGPFFKKIKNNPYINVVLFSQVNSCNDIKRKCKNLSAKLHRRNKKIESIEAINEELRKRMDSDPFEMLRDCFPVAITDLIERKKNNITTEYPDSIRQFAYQSHSILNQPMNF